MKLMTESEHKQKHIELHKALDELFADFITHHSGCSAFTQMPVITLITWSAEQTENPTGS